MMRKDEIQVIGVANILDVAWSISDAGKARQIILEVDKAQADVGFTEDLIVTLIKAMKKEYKRDKEAMEEFKNLINGALK
jgi:hypothetical protein